jgi:hypothetical protein
MGHGGHEHGHHHDHGDHDHGDHDHDDHGHHAGARPAEASLVRRFAAIAGPFGAAASPDLTILPVALAASAVGLGTVIACLVSFSTVTIGTFITLTVAATLAGYQVKGAWLEEHGNHLTGLVLIGIGIAVYLGL